MESEVLNGTSIARITVAYTKSKVNYWSNAVYAQVLGANPPYVVMNGYFRRVWHDRGIEKVLRMGLSLFLIRFHRGEDRDAVLQRECVSFDYKSVIISQRKPDFEKETAPHVSVWIRFPELPLQYWGCDALSKIASQLGSPIEMDAMTRDKTQPNFSRVRVRMPITVCLQEQVTFVDKNDRVVEQQVEYEWRPVLCSKCNMFGHEGKVCRKQQEATNQWVPKKTSAQEQNASGWQTVVRNKGKGKEAGPVQEVVPVQGTANTGQGVVTDIPVGSIQAEASGSSKDSLRQEEELIDKGSSHA